MSVNTPIRTLQRPPMPSPSGKSFDTETEPSPLSNPSKNKSPNQLANNRRSTTRVVVMSDATPERNGVGSYYADLVSQIRPHVAHAELVDPQCKTVGSYRYLTAPLPGDSTQRVSLPRLNRLKRVIADINPTVVIVPTPGPFGLAGLYIARHLRAPLIVGFHTHYEALAELYWTDTFGTVCQRYLHWCNKLLFRNSALVLANSTEMQHQAQLGGAADAQLMGTSLPLYYVQKPVLPMRNGLKRVLFAGRLADEKNLPAIIDSARQHPELEFSIAGDGPLKNSVQKAANELSNLNWLGWIKREDLIHTIDTHDLLLLPSKVESFGTVALEGMARGKLVIVTADCGISQWPKLKEALYVVQNNETPSQTLSRILSQHHKQLEYTAGLARARALELNQWNIQSWIDRIEQVQVSNNPSNKVCA